MLPPRAAGCSVHTARKLAGPLFITATAPPETFESSPRSSGSEGSWERLESWLHAHAPRIAAGLGAAAPIAAIEAAEREIGFPFPEDFRRSLRVHDGERVDVGSVAGMRLNSLEAMLDDWRAMERLRQDGAFEPPPGLDSTDFESVRGMVEAIADKARAWVAAAERSPRRPSTSEPPSMYLALRGGHWNRGWIPIASSGDGNSFSLDLEPSEAGTVGQVLRRSVRFSLPS